MELDHNNEFIHTERKEPLRLDDSAATVKPIIAPFTYDSDHLKPLSTVESFSSRTMIINIVSSATLPTD
jgi:hypothetical protein